MTNVLTREQALTALRKIIAERGENYVYRGPDPHSNACVYKDGESPSCIIGHLVAREFPEVFDEINVAISNNADSYSLINSRGSYQPEAPIVAEDSNLASQIRQLQSAQDRQRTWGDAFYIAFGEPV